MQATKFPRAYRAWNLDTQTMLMPDELVKTGFTITPDGLPSYREMPFAVVLMWFSGKQDVNNQPIFEGDICKVQIKNEFGSMIVDYGIMRWESNMSAFMLQVPSLNAGQMLDVQSVELLGNEFQNPELVPLVKLPVK